MYENIFEYVTQQEIFEKYWFPVDFKQKFINPLRPDDTKAGCYYKLYNNSLFFVDWASPEKSHYSCIDIVCLMFNLSASQAFNKIKEDFGLDFKVYSFKSPKLQPKYIITDDTEDEKSEPCQIDYVRQEFNINDIKYWNQYGISINTLNKYNVYPAFKVYISNVLYHLYTNADPMYVYEEMDYKKVYRPFGGKKVKWRTNFKGGLLEGYTQLPDYGNLLIITKSRKDVMVLHEMNINSVAVKSETSLVSVNAMNLLRERFKEIICLFDNDNTGIDSAKKMTSIYNLKSISIDKRYMVKDISDFAKKYNFNDAKKYIKHLLNEN